MLINWLASILRENPPNLVWITENKEQKNSEQLLRSAKWDLEKLKKKESWTTFFKNHNSNLPDMFSKSDSLTKVEIKT